jgi:hypothetical protein
MKHFIAIALLLTSAASAGVPKGTEYKIGALAAGANSHGAFAAHIYHVIGEDGWEYTLAPGSNDPMRRILLESQVKYRFDKDGNFWTPDPRPNKPDHEAKYRVELVERVPIPDSSKSVLTNDDVVMMVETGLSPAVIIAKVRVSVPNFDISVGALKYLKEKKVPDSVVSEMISRIGQ